MAALSGNAMLDTGAAATLVLVRDWDDYQHVAAVVPGADGGWTVDVPNGRPYEVTVRGGSGYQPITDGPFWVGE